MFKKIAGTALTRILNAVIMLMVLFIATNNLGAETYGTVTLVILGVTIIGLVNHFVGGGALVYYVPRQPLFLLLVPSYLWAFVSAAAVAYVLSLLNKIPEGYTFHVMALALFQSLSSINQNVMLGKEQVGHFNLVSLIQFGMLLATLSLFVLYYQEKDALAYIKALYVAYISAFVLSSVLVYRYVSRADLRDAAAAVSKMLNYGWKAQLANILQFFNYRLNHYILEAFFNKAALGVFSAGVQLSEGMWIIGKSVSMVQFSKTVNTTDKTYVKNLAVNLVKMTFVLTLLMLIVVLLLPVELFVLLFGEEFGNIKMVILTLAPGIVIVPCSMVLSAYFSGTGKPHISAIGSGSGLLATLLIGFTIIPLYGLPAAGITASATYLIIAAYLFNRFLRIAGGAVRDFYPKREDLIFLKKELKTVLKK
jgi:O-antigen/teichoic acid export membrane protein